MRTAFLEVRLAEICLLEVRLAEICLVEMRSSKDRVLEMPLAGALAEQCVP